MPNEEYIEGIGPNNASKNEDLMDHLRTTNQKFSEHNRKMSERRAAKLEEVGGFRAMESTGGTFTRGFKPRFEATVRQVGTVDGNEVTDGSGNQFLTRLVQPVKGATADTGPVRIEQKGQAQTRARQSRLLQQVADGSKRYLDGLRTAAASPRLLKVFRQLSTPAVAQAAFAEARLNIFKRVKLRQIRQI